jgi:transposase
MGEAVAGALAGIRQDGEHQRVTSGGGQQFGQGGFGGPQTGPNPTDRAKNGSKQHVLTDARGIPLAVRLTGANVHDVTQLQPWVEAIPPIPGRRGRPRQRPASVQGDRAYASEPHRQWLRACRIQPLWAQRETAQGSGLGRTRWGIERTMAWLHLCRRLRIRWERRDEIH